MTIREIKEKLWILPIGDLQGVGKKTLPLLKELKINTIGDLANTNPDILKSHLKSHGYVLWQYANGIDDSVVEPIQAAAKGIGNSHTLSKDATTKEEACKTLLALADSVAIRLRKSGVYASMVSVEIKYSDFRQASHQCSLKTPVNTASAIYEAACSLFDELWDASPIRLLGIRTSKLVDVLEPTQLSLFDFMGETNSLVSNPKISQKQEKLENALDIIREKYGKDAIVRGSKLQK